VIISSKPAFASQQLIKILDDLPADVSVATRVAQMAADETVNIAQIVTVVRQDETLVVRLMRLANSSFYGMDRRVLNVEFAIRLVGFQAVRSLALRTLVETQANTGSTPGWMRMRSARQAAAARELASIFDVPVPDAFAVGLLSDIGAMLLWRVDEKAYLNTIKIAAGDRTAQLAAQREYFGLDQDQTGAKAFSAWSLPPTMVQALQYPPTATAPAFVRLLAVARQLASDELPELTTELVALTGGRLDPNKWAQLYGRVTDAAFDIANE